MPDVDLTTQAKNEDAAFKKEITKLGCKFALTTNVFISPDEFTTSETNYDPNERWGTHIKEGNFCELLDWLSNKDQLLLLGKRCLFVKFVCHDMACVYIWLKYPLVHAGL